MADWDPLITATFSYAIMFDETFNDIFYRGEHLLLFLAQTVARQTIEQRQFRPHRSAADSRPKSKTKSLGTGGATPPLPDHDLDPPKFARRALEFILQDWRAVSAMMRDGYRSLGEARYGILLYRVIIIDESMVKTFGTLHLHVQSDQRLFPVVLITIQSISIPLKRCPKSRIDRMVAIP